MIFLTSWGDCVNEMELVEVGQRIQSRRRQMGLTQEQLADKMNVSKQMVSNLERGQQSNPHRQSRCPESNTERQHRLHPDWEGNHR